MSSSRRKILIVDLLCREVLAKTQGRTAEFLLERADGGTMPAEVAMNPARAFADRQGLSGQFPQTALEFSPFFVVQWLMSKRLQQRFGRKIKTSTTGPIDMSVTISLSAAHTICRIPRAPLAAALASVCLLPNRVEGTAPS